MHAGEGQAGGGRAGGGDEIELVGRVERVTFQAPGAADRPGAGARFSVLRLALEEDRGGAAQKPPRSPPEPVFAVGPIAGVGEGQRLRLAGRWTNHPRHGPRFQFTRADALPPADEDGLVRYLSSAAFPGIGPVLAERIVRAFGLRSLDVIRESPARLREVRGLSAKSRAALAQRLGDAALAHELRSFLLGAGLYAHQVEAVVDRLGAGALDRVRADPFALASAGIAGIGFLSADRMARSLGLPQDSPERARAAIVHALEQAAAQGHSCLPSAALLEQASALLRGEIPRERLAEALLVLRRTEQVAFEPELRPGVELAYLPAIQGSEAGIARSLARTAARASGARADSSALRKFEAALAGMRPALDPSQREAVLGLLDAPVGLLTGGPGVGKTTTVRALVELAEREGRRVALAAPTGRAAKRLQEATGREAATIHRLLGYDPGRRAFAHDERRPLECDLLVLDEASMLDVYLAHDCFRALGRGTRLVLVGDPDQLPSVAAGNVLRDLLASQCFPTFRLTTIHRQGEGSGIVRNAHRVLAGEWPEFSEAVEPAGSSSPADFFYFPADDEESAAARAVEVVTERIPKRFGLSWEDAVQVLAPMYRGACGVDALNERLRAARARTGDELEWGGARFGVGERVIQTRNDYDKQVFNGDLGRVARVLSGGRGLAVDFPDREVVYERGEVGALQLAFAITVHRAQGSEFPAVVVPLVPQHYLMLQRHLLYTAITRATRLVVIVGARRALRRAIENAETGRRESALAERLLRAMR